jgi:hypothetical protein
MNKAKIRIFFLITLSVLIAGACSKPPAAEMDAAAAAVSRAEKDTDTVEYAPDALKRAKDSLARMQSEASAKKYDSAKTLAGETVKAVEKAMADGKAAKARARDDAAALVGAIKALSAEVESALAAARKVRGIKLEFDAAARDIQAAAGTVAAAESDLAGGNYKAVMEKGQAVRSVLGTIKNRIAEAVQATSRKK